MDSRTILEYLFYTLGVGAVGYLAYLLCRQLAILLLVILFLFGGIMARGLVSELNWHPVLAVLVMGLWVGFSSIPLFMLSSIEGLETRMGRVAKRVKNGGKNDNPVPASEKDLAPVERV